MNEGRYLLTTGSKINEIFSSMEDKLHHFNSFRSSRHVTGKKSKEPLRDSMEWSYLAVPEEDEHEK